MIVLLIALTLILAFANGSNDVSKGVATLVGSGVTNFRRAVVWGAIWTVAGGLFAAVASQQLVKAFSGSGLLATMPAGQGFLIAAAVGAIGWIAFASVTGLPVSTTHAITGALCGAGVMAAGFEGVKWGVVGQKFALPLAVSPLVSLGLMWALFPVVQFCFARLNNYCVCVEKLTVLECGDLSPLLETDKAAASCRTPNYGTLIAPSVIVGASADCAIAPAVLSRLNMMDSLHWVSAGATSFARGLNDTPKILALSVVAIGLMNVSVGVFYVWVALAMGAGSLIAGLRVTETLARKVTPMNPTEGFAANLITAVLVGWASRLGLPVSTTHVSSSAIIGIGLRKGGQDVRWKTVRDMLLAWVVTLPVAALVAAGIYWLIK